MSLMNDTPALPSIVILPAGPLVHDVTSSHISSGREKVIEYRFLADLTVELFRRGLVFDILRGDVDAMGYDLVIEAGDIVRHVQLKAMYKGGKRADVTANIRLTTRPSGCIIWMVYDPATLGIVSFRWFGGEASEPLPDIGTRIAKHSKCNAQGIKTERPAHRVVPKRAFAVITDMTTLTDRLFGPGA